MWSTAYWLSQPDVTQRWDNCTTWAIRSPLCAATCISGVRKSCWPLTDRNNVGITPVCESRSQQFPEAAEEAWEKHRPTDQSIKRHHPRYTDVDSPSSWSCSIIPVQNRNKPKPTALSNSSNYISEKVHANRFTQRRVLRVCGQTKVAKDLIRAEAGCCFVFPIRVPTRRRAVHKSEPIRKKAEEQCRKWRKPTNTQSF